MEATNEIKVLCDVVCWCMFLTLIIKYLLHF